MTLPDLSAWLRRHGSDDAVLSLDRVSVQRVQQELQRLHQSSERMRRQNSKLRNRIAKLKAGTGDIDLEAAPEEAPEDAPNGATSEAPNEAIADGGESP